MRIKSETNERGVVVTSSEDNVMAFGQIDLEKEEKSQCSIISIEHLERAIRTLKNINKTECSIRVQEDMPVLFCPGNSKHSRTGLMIAPRIDESND